MLWKPPCQFQDSRLQKAYKESRRQHQAALRLILYVLDHAGHGGKEKAVLFGYMHEVTDLMLEPSH